MRTFLSTLSLRRATFLVLLSLSTVKIFLSTLSLRRATAERLCNALEYLHFYPRSPCGERQALGLLGWLRVLISIHALLAESDPCGAARGAAAGVFLSTLSLRRATSRRSRRQRHRNFYPRSPCGERPALSQSSAKSIPISIHALLAESDRVYRKARYHMAYFYPRSPCGERPISPDSTEKSSLFLSTLSLRRATKPK